MQDTEEHKQPIIWSPESIADLDGIWDYYERPAGGQTAELMIRRIHQNCIVVGEHPGAGRPRDELRPGLHSFPAPPFIVLYQLDDDGRPQIVRVLDGRQDIDPAIDPNAAP